MLATDDFWTSITGTHDFGGRLLKVSVILAPLIKRRAEAEVTRIKREARALFADKDGDLNLDALANPPKLRRKKRKPTAKQK